MHASLTDDVLRLVLYEAYRPVPWPWSEYRLVSRNAHKLCHRYQTRGWYIAHSTLST